MLGENKKNNHKTLIGILIILIVVAAYSFFLRPMAGDVNVLKADLDDKRGELTTLASQVETFEAAQQNLDLATEVERSAVLKSVPIGLNQDGVILDVIEIAEENDIELTSIGFGRGSSSRDGVDSLRINASFQGNYTDLTNFLESVEQNARIFLIKTINIQVSQGEITGIQRVNFSLSMDAFYQED